MLTSARHRYCQDTCFHLDSRCTGTNIGGRRRSDATARAVDGGRSVTSNATYTSIQRLIVLTLCLLTTMARAGSTAETVLVGRAVPKQNQVSIDQVDHSLWTQLLHKYVDENGNVAYKTWKANPGDLAMLQRYLGQLSTANPNLQASRDSRLAFWSNAYNAVTIHGILREYPTSSIRNHTPRLFGYHIWKDLKLRVGSGQFSLEDIEHNVLRKMGEPRIHFAIVCASRSCPKLPNEAYSASAVGDQFERNARDFFADTQNFRYDRTSNRMFLSSILQWFSDDFGRDQAGVLKRIAKWLPTEAARSAAAHGKVRVNHLRYDWSLNEQ